ncbi:DUF4192 domain-containing protein [Streptomyces jeddahensis]|uniref:DUF4192 domain-containing protein n=1 Tax=Streptomyces jeddahensis TaxID=1716141 RepID=A0A177HVL3_9ACTN|nr:DUF4192 domain-containing protein [Streptomyces jeddahensis]OAH14669.1 hypothetical protein STSP_19300 [Streptomyces jeddahensis]
MTNHHDSTGAAEPGDITTPSGHGDPVPVGRGESVPSGHGEPVRSEHGGSAAFAYGGSPDLVADQQITLRTASELADALPYLLGYRPEDSIVLVAVHDRNGRGRFGARARLGIPEREEDWPPVAQQLAQCLVTGSERRGARPEGMVVFLCQDPAGAESGQQVMQRLRPLAQSLRTACGGLDVPVVEALCISGGRSWSYCCPGERCCPPEGVSLGLPGTSVLAAAATYAGMQVRGTLSELRARLVPWGTQAAAEDQESALDAAVMTLIPRMLDEEDGAKVAAETLDLARRVIGRLAGTPPVGGTHRADLRDDELIAHDEAAALILGLQDRKTRDQAAEWMEGDEAPAALRLWRALARRCVGAYGEHAAAPLTLAGWVAWSLGDELEGREALAMALGADPGYTFAVLLHRACNEGLDPESIRSCLRSERAEREAAAPDHDQDPSLTPAARSPRGTLRAQPSSVERPALPMGPDRRRRRSGPGAGPGAKGKRAGQSSTRPAVRRRVGRRTARSDQ